jgi:hypothetical protein
MPKEKRKQTKENKERNRKARRDIRRGLYRPYNKVSLEKRKEYGTNYLERRVRNNIPTIVNRESKRRASIEGLLAERIETIRSIKENLNR